MIINETAAKEFGADSVIGLKMKRLNQHQEVIGIYKDVHTESFRQKIKPSVIINYRMMLHRVIIKINGHNKKESIKLIEKAWNDINPDVPFQYNFLDDKYDKLYKTEEKFGNGNKIFCFIFHINCLFRLVRDDFIYQRKKEKGNWCSKS